VHIDLTRRTAPAGLSCASVPASIASQFLGSMGVHHRQSDPHRTLYVERPNQRLCTTWCWRGQD